MGQSTPELSLGMSSGKGKAYLPTGPRSGGWLGAADHLHLPFRLGLLLQPACLPVLSIKTSLLLLLFATAAGHPLLETTCPTA